MPDPITFVFSVVCVGPPTQCRKMDSEDKLDAFTLRMGQIRNELRDRGKERYAEHLLSLGTLGVYVGRPGPGQRVDELPPVGDTVNRYGRPIFVGSATGQDIFTKTMDQLKEIDQMAAHIEMKKWQVKFNYLLHEIFSWNGDGKGSYVDYSQANPDNYHPRHFEPDPDLSAQSDEVIRRQRYFDHTSDIDHPWYAAWTVFVTSSGSPYGMNGSGAC